MKFLKHNAWICIEEDSKKIEKTFTSKKRADRYCQYQNKYSYGNAKRIIISSKVYRRLING